MVSVVIIGVFLFLTATGGAVVSWFYIDNWWTWLFVTLACAAVGFVAFGLIMQPVIKGAVQSLAPLAVA